MITPRRTRLIRASDLHAFRRLVDAVGVQAEAVVVVPNRAAAWLLESRRAGVRAVTRDELYDLLHGRLPGAPRRLTAFERDAIAQAAAAEGAQAVPDLPFRIRPGLVSEVLRFYDQFRRQRQTVGRFAELIGQALGGSADADRGAARMIRQTRFLELTLAAYERRVRDSGACDEHVLRGRLAAEPVQPPLRSVVVTVGDWIADPDGLFVADFDLLTRMPGLEAIDVVATERLLESGLHQRLHEWLPGLEEAEARDLAGTDTVQPRLSVPRASPEQLWFVRRDREEELLAVARAVSRDEAGSDAVVYKRPLPYLYLAPVTLGAAGITYRTADALPLAAEPAAASVDLVLEVVETSFAREPLVALLGSPHFGFGADDRARWRSALAVFDRTLSERRYLGDAAKLQPLARCAAGDRGWPALEAALAVARELAPLCGAAAASTLLDALAEFLKGHWRPLGGGDPFADRETRVRAAVIDLLAALCRAHSQHHDPEWTVADLAAAVRRGLQGQTFAAAEGPGARVHLVDDRAARYGDFDRIAIVGVIDQDWPERPARNVFYPPTLLKALGWPSEKDRSAAAAARFLDLVGSARRTVALSTVSLEDDSIVTRSILLDELARAGLSAVADETDAVQAVVPDDRLAQGLPILDSLPPLPAGWAAMRLGRPSHELPQFHGAAGSPVARVWPVSAVETYLECPFKFFARHVLALDEEPIDEETVDPRRQGQLVHRVFEQFFRAWQEAGLAAITPDNLAEARARFAGVVDRELAGQALTDAEAALERTRLVGSPAAVGLGEAVFQMEAQRPVAVVERLIEHTLGGELRLETREGPRVVALKGKADRIDLLQDGTFRLIDYKLGWPPDRSRALQLPVYALYAEQRLRDYRGRRFVLGEAAYLAFKGPRRVVPLFASPSQRAEVMARAQERLAAALDGIERGAFPPTPADVYRCETCSFAAVCRKDYVAS